MPLHDQEPQPTEIGGYGDASVGSATCTTLPAPSHALRAQSPAVCVVVPVDPPAGTRCVPHTPLVQMRHAHSVSAPGQSAALAQEGGPPEEDDEEDEDAHRPPTHSPCEPQSASTEQCLPPAHGAQTGPPQSISVSNPSFWPSPHRIVFGMQDSAWHALFTRQAVPSGAAVRDGSVPRHDQEMHGVEAGASVGLATWTTWPAPSHVASLQSPVICALVGVPAGT